MHTLRAGFHRIAQRPYRGAVTARGYSPTDLAALKCLYLVTRSLDPPDTVELGKAIRCKPAPDAFDITFEGRIVPSTTN